MRGYENFCDPRIASTQRSAIISATVTPEVNCGQAIAMGNIFDLAYYPTDKGPYNFDSRPGSVAPNGKLLNPTQRWGGIMRAIDQAETDFETTKRK